MSDRSAKLRSHAIELKLNGLERQIQHLCSRRTLFLVVAKVQTSVELSLAAAAVQPLHTSALPDGQLMRSQLVLAKGNE